MRRRMPESKVATKGFFEEYKANLTNMDETNEGAISHGFLKIVLTVANRMLAVPEIANIIREADSKSLTSFTPSGITQGCKR